MFVGREYDRPDDVEQVAGLVLVYQLVLMPDTKVAEVDEREVVDDVLSAFSVPTV